MNITPAAQHAMFRHARDMAAKTPPEESVGILSDGQYIACPNLSVYPEKSFRLGRDILAQHQPVEAIIHSHPGGNACPSSHDMRQQIASHIPWVVVVVPTAGKPDIPECWFSWGHPPQLDMLVGYRHGVTDCYGLIRGWFSDKAGVILPDYPREWEWWHGKENLYLDHFADAGFAPISAISEISAISPSSAIRRGDVFLAAIRSPVPNHAGIYIGHGLILHHLAGARPADPSRLPRKEPVERWKRFITTWLRHPETG